MKVSLRLYLMTSFLFSPTILVGMEFDNNKNETDLITLVSNENESFVIDKSKAYLSETLKNILSMSREKQTKRIEFKHIDSQALRSIVQVLQANDTHRKECLKNIIIKKNKDELQSFDTAFDFLQIKNKFLTMPMKSISLLSQLAIDQFSKEIKDNDFFITLFFKEIKIHNQNRVAEISFSSLYETLYCCAVDGDDIYVAGLNGVIYVCNKNSSLIVNQFAAHSFSIRSLIVEGNTIISASDDMTVKMWDKKSLQRIGIFQPAVYCLISTSNMIISGSSNGDLIFWDKNNGNAVNTVRYKGYPHSLVMDGDNVIVAFYGDTRESIVAINKESGVIDRVIVDTVEDSTYFRSLFVYYDILFAAYNNGLKIYDKISGEYLGELKNSTNLGHIVNNMVVNNSKSYDSTWLKMWDIAKYKEFCDFLKSELFISHQFALVQLEEDMTLQKKPFLTPARRMLLENFLQRLEERWGEKIKQVAEMELYKMYREEPRDCSLI